MQNYAYRALMLRTSRIRVGRRFRTTGLPAILVATALLTFASCAGLALVFAGIATLVRASQPGNAQANDAEPIAPPPNRLALAERFPAAKE